MTGPLHYFRSLDQFSKGRLKSIDFLRGIAATAVLFHHALLYSDYGKVEGSWFTWFAALMNQGHLGVPLFFVISGYCIHAKSAQSIAQGVFPKLNFVSFWKRRFFRLYPNYLTVLFGSMLIVYVAYKLGKDVAAVRMYPEPKPTWMLKDLFAHIFMLHGFHPLFDKGGGNSPMWTLAREEYLYLLYFPLMFLRRYFNIIKCAIIVFAFSVVFYLLCWWLLASDNIYWNIIQSSAIVLWIQWVAGSVAVEARAGLIHPPKIFANMWVVLPLYFLAHEVPTFAANQLGDDFYFVIKPLLWALVFFVTVNAATELESKGRWPQSRFFTFFSRTGIFSYSLYLLHHPVIAVTKQFLGPLKATTNPFLYIAATAILIVVGFASSLVLFYFVESRFLK